MLLYQRLSLPVTPGDSSMHVVEKYHFTNMVFSSQLVNFNRKMAVVVNGNGFVSETHAENHTLALKKL